jgi:hypothetical protein
MQSNAARQAGGPAIATGEPAAERSDPNYRDVALDQRLRQALVRPNTDMPPEALEHACRKLTLTPARDTLLPKLVFGELRVRDAGRFINKHP